MGVSPTSLHNNGFAVTIAPTGGFISKSKIENGRIYPTQSGHGTICFGRTDALRKLDFGSERWLEAAGYALPDDQVMFYKLFLQGNRNYMHRQSILNILMLEHP